MNVRQAKFREACQRVVRLHENTQALLAASRTLIHDARNTRHHAALLRTLSTIIRRAQRFRVGREAGTG